MFKKKNKILSSFRDNGRDHFELSATPPAETENRTKFFQNYPCLAKERDVDNITQSRITAQSSAFGLIFIGSSTLGLLAAVVSPLTAVIALTVAIVFLVSVTWIH